MLEKQAVIFHQLISFNALAIRTITSPFRNGIILSQRLKNVVFMILLVTREFKTKKYNFVRSSVPSNFCFNTSPNACVHHGNCFFDPYIQWT